MAYDRVLAAEASSSLIGGPKGTGQGHLDTHPTAPITSSIVLTSSIIFPSRPPPTTLRSSSHSCPARASSTHVLSGIGSCSLVTDSSHVTRNTAVPEHSHPRRRRARTLPGTSSRSYCLYPSRFSRLLHPMSVSSAPCL
jgi:hypothetical protein